MTVKQDYNYPVFNSYKVKAFGGHVIPDFTFNEPEELGPSDSTGNKFDQGKSRLELIPPELLFATADILTFGASKYGERNWEKGMKWSRVYGALMRHLWCWWGSKKPDPETGKSHLWHAASCIAFLIAYESRTVGEDDRTP